MIEKKLAINFLVILIFPFLGMSTYLMPTVSPSFGLLVSFLPSMIIIIIFTIDTIYENRIVTNFTKVHFVFLLFLCTAAIAQFIAFKKGYPNLSMAVTISRILQLFTIYISFLIFNYYNKNDNKIQYTVLFTSLSVLLLLNVVGYFGIGLAAPFREIDGRINFPFSGGVYGANNIIIPLIFLLFYYLKKIKFTENPILKLALWLYLFMCFSFIFIINARLFILTLIIVLVIFFFKFEKLGNTITVISLFTLPFLISLRFFLPIVLSAPPFNILLQRVDVRGITTFNNRIYLWEPALEWLENLGQGVLFGNGYKGYYFIRLVEKNSYINPGFLSIDKHLHSATLEILLSQGIFGYTLFFIIFLILVNYYIYKSKDDLGYKSLYMIVLYIILVSHYDGNVAVFSLGFYILSYLYANVKPIPKLNT